jgi:hypothetical protein
VAILAVVVAAAVVARRRARGLRALAQLRDGCAPLAAPWAYAASVTPWQLASRASRIAAVACFLGAFHLPVTPRTVLVVIVAQASGRVLPFAPAALGAGVVVLAATFGAAAHGAVGTGRVVAFLVGTTTLLTLMGAAIAIAVIVRNMDRWTLARAARRTPAAQAPAG